MKNKDKNEEEKFADELLKTYSKVFKPSLFQFIFYTVVILLGMAGLTLMIYEGGQLLVEETLVLILLGGWLTFNAWSFFHGRKEARKDISELEKELRKIDVEDDNPTDEKMTAEEYQKLMGPFKRFLILEFTLNGVGLMLELAGLILRYINPLLSHIFNYAALCFYIIAFVIYLIYKKRSLIK